MPRRDLWQARLVARFSSAKSPWTKAVRLRRFAFQGKTSAKQNGERSYA